MELIVSVEMTGFDIKVGQFNGFTKPKFKFMLTTVCLEQIL